MKLIACVCLLMMIGALSLIYFNQRHLIYFPTNVKPLRADFHAMDMQEIVLSTSDKLHLSAWYKPARPNQATVLILHGNAGNIGHRMPLARYLINAGFGVLLLEYRGYGGNSGNPTELGFYQDANAALLFLRKEGLPLSQLVFFGESLGTGVAVYLASKNPACALILQSPYTSLTALARFHYPWMFLPLWDKFDSLARIKAVKSPLLILHGKEDNIVPMKQGLILFEAANSPKQWLEVTDRGHAGLWTLPVLQQLAAFITNHCK